MHSARYRSLRSAMKGAAKQSSVFAREIFTTISPIPEEPPEVIEINKMPLNLFTFLSKYENNKKKNNL